MKRDSVKPKVRRIPGTAAKRWTKFHMKHAAQTTYEEGVVWNRQAPAKGPFFTDVDGNVLLDFVSHVAAAPLGYNNPEITKMLKAFQFLDPDRYAGTDFISGYGRVPNKNFPTPSHLHEKVHEITKHLKMNMAFFTNSGAEAAENALKLAYNYKKNFGQALFFEGAFHGRTLGALSVNRSKAVHTDWYPSTLNKRALPFVSTTDDYTYKWIKCNGRLELTALEEMFHKKIGTLKPKEVAAIIVEPVQGEGGYNIADKRFLKEVFKFGKSNDIPIIADEIQSGLGRTGEWWAVDHFNVRPDILTSAKALRVGATVANKKYFPKEKGRISSTWGEGNAMASAVGYKTIEIIQKKKLLKNAKVRGKQLVTRLQELEQKYPKKVKNSRGLGLMDAIDVWDAKLRNKILNKALKQGLLLAGCGTRSMRFLPPLDVTEREINLAMDLFEYAVKKA